MPTLVNGVLFQEKIMLLINVPATTLSLVYHPILFGLKDLSSFTKMNLFSLRLENHQQAAKVPT